MFVALAALAAVFHDVVFNGSSPAKYGVAATIACCVPRLSDVQGKHGCEVA